MSKTKVLVIDDDESMLELAEFHLRAAGFESVRAQTGQRGIELIESDRFDVVLIDLNLPDKDGIEVMRRLKELSPDTEIIMITGYGSVTKAVEATKAGAFYFVEKPVEFEELVILIGKAVERRQQAEEIRQLRGRLTSRTSYYNIIGSSKALQQVYEIIDSVAETDANVLVIGESGTGKELIANAIHYKSRRAKKPFVKINCAALPKELIESELFGHTRGAFTGASMDKAGLISQADSGSLLLDEISEMPVELQPKLLRVLQERMYYRLGSEKAQEANFRLISCTNRNPADAIRDGHLREDLYYRISTIEIPVPPLRERVEDIQHLAEHFLEEFAQKYQRTKCTLSRQSYERLFEYSWPGNVRELQNVLERAVLLCRGQVIQSDDLTIDQSGRGEAALARAAKAAEEPAIPVASQETASRAAAFSSAPPSLEAIGEAVVEIASSPAANSDGNDMLAAVERVIVDAALKKTGGNKQATAKLLGVYRPRVYSLIKKHQLMGAPQSSQSKPAATGPENGGSSEAQEHSQETVESAGPGDRSE
jgi:DNA-binding NtrC family response regulator